MLGTYIYSKINFCDGIEYFKVKTDKGKYVEKIKNGSIVEIKFKSRGKAPKGISLNNKQLINELNSYYESEKIIRALRKSGR